MASNIEDSSSSTESGNAPVHTEKPCPSLLELASRAVAYLDVETNNQKGDREITSQAPVASRTKINGPEMFQKGNKDQVYLAFTHKNQHPHDKPVIDRSGIAKDAFFRPINRFDSLDKQEQQSQSENVGLLWPLAFTDEEDDRPRKTCTFGKLLTKCSLIRKKNKKPKKRALSLCSVAERDKKAKKLLQSQNLKSGFKLNENGADAETRELPFPTESRSIHVCCGMENGYGDHGKEADQWSNNADVSSVDGSCFSDNSADDLEADLRVQGHPFKPGAGTTDTDTDDDAAGSPKKQASGTKNVEEEPLQQKIGQIPPLLIYYNEARREFHWHRFYFNHYENVDFSVFEFGNRTSYLIWRCACLLITTVLLFSMSLDSGIRGLDPFPGTDIDLCLHLWLAWLLLVQLTIEVTVLGLQFFLYPTCYLARVHTTPIYWKLVWGLNNIIAANAMSLIFMNACVFRNNDIENFGIGARVHLTLTLMTLTQTTIGAIPVRLAHGLYPMLLTLAFILYVNSYRPCSSSLRYNPNPLSTAEDQDRIVGNGGHPLEPSMIVDLCYLEPIMWHVNRACGAIFSTLWVTTTFICHCTFVLVCWFRRVVFRYRRKHSVPVYGQSTTTHFYPQHGAEVSPHMVRMVEEDGFKAKDFVTGYDQSPPFTPTVLKRRWTKRGLSKAEQDALGF